MIFIGNDIIEVSRVDRLIQSYGEHFLRKVFSEDEINIVNKRKKISMHFSGKFSAKEASKKALMTAGISNIYLKDIEILNNYDGSPYVRIKNLESNFIKNFKISISHCNKYATAFSILELSDL